MKMIYETEIVLDSDVMNVVRNRSINGWSVFGVWPGDTAFFIITFMK